MSAQTLSTLRRLLGEMSPEEFRSNFYGRRPLLIRGHSAWAREIFGWEDLNRLLSTSAIPHSTMRLSRKGMPPFVASDASSVIDACRAGASLVINTIHLFSPSIGAFSRSLEKDLGEPVNVNMYCASADNPAFACHYDCHDIMLLQLEGSKHWKIYAPTILSPLFDMKDHGIAPSSSPILDVTLHAGDFLYVPRGFWHEVVAVGGLSLHLTVGLDAYTGIDFLSWVVDELRSELEFRATLPLVLDGEQTEARREHVLHLRDALARKLSDPATLRDYRSRFVATRKSVNPFHFPSHLLDQPARSSGATTFTRPSHQLAELSEDGLEIKFTCIGRVLRFPLAARPVLERILADELVTIDALQAGSPQLPADAIWAILDSLCREGLIEPRTFALSTTGKNPSQPPSPRNAISASA
jgi:ribosomal protein L16 Arg81 hydroxylase